MEVRCGNCNKLFRVSDDKISGRGVKFVCTRCGEYVRITMEDFSTYALSKTAVSALDLFGSTPKSASTEIESRAEERTESASSAASTFPEISAAEPTNKALQETELPTYSVPDISQEKEASAKADLSSVEEPSYHIGQPQANEPEYPPQVDLHHEPLDVAQAELEQKPELPLGIEAETAKTGVALESESAFGMARENVEEVHSEPEERLKTQPEPVAETAGSSPESEPLIAMLGETPKEVYPGPEKSTEPQPESEREVAREPVAMPESETAVKMSTGTMEDVYPGPEKSAEPQPETAADTTEVPGREPGIVSAGILTEAVQPEQRPEPEPEAQMKTTAIPVEKPQPEVRPEPEPAEIPEIKLEPPQPQIYRPQTDSQPVSESKPGGVFAAPAALRKEPSQRASSPISVIKASPAESPRARSQAIVIMAVIIILALGGIGAFMLLRSTGTTTKESAAHLTSTEGLNIVNASGSLEPNGDLIISGFVENSTDKPQSSWLIVVDVYDAKGAIVNKLRLLNGKQLYTRSDYDMLAKRGAPIQEMKARALQEQGTVIPPKDKVPFEIRYLQPPSGIASFDATLQPFDPAQISKEAAEQAS